MFGYWWWFYRITFNSAITGKWRDSQGVGVPDVPLPSNVEVVRSLICDTDVVRKPLKGFRDSII